VECLGADAVAGVDPSTPFVAAASERLPHVDIRRAAAELLPFADATFDAALAQLVVHFMEDPVAGLREMSRVTRPGGVVAACMWDLAGGGMTLLRVFWTAVREVDRAAEGERRLAGTSEGDITQRLRRAGLEDVTDGTLTADASYQGFDDFWEPFTFEVGPAGRYLRSLGADRQASVRDACRAALPAGPFSLQARAWCARGTVPTWVRTGHGPDVSRVMSNTAGPKGAVQ